MRSPFAFAIPLLSTLAVLHAGDVPWVEGSTTLVLLPDTQWYTKSHPATFKAQTEWVVANRASRHIAYVLHMGDITEHNLPQEWDVAKEALSLLDDRVPYSLLPGNHDYSGEGRNTLLSQHFPVEKMRKWPTFGGVFEDGKMDNSYHLFELNGRPWINLALEFGPRNEVVEWANKTLDRYSDRLAIVSTHAYLFRDNTRFDYTKGSQRASPHDMGNDGEELWQKLISLHANVMLVVCGHVRAGGVAYLASEGRHGNVVHQVLNDYEAMRGGGSGYMRLLEFLPDGKTVQVKAYSPVLNKHLADPQNQFTLTLSPGPQSGAKAKEDR